VTSQRNWNWRERAISIIAEVATKHGLSPLEVLAVNKHRHIVHARQAAMLAVREQTGLSYELIGDMFCRDHTTVIYGIRRAAERRSKP